jgi:hypothetical protein
MGTVPLLNTNRVERESFTTKDTKITKFKIIIFETFVSFVRFVVRKCLSGRTTNCRSKA